MKLQLGNIFKEVLCNSDFYESVDALYMFGNLEIQIHINNGAPRLNDYMSANVCRRKKNGYGQRVKTDGSPQNN